MEIKRSIDAEGFSLDASSIGNTSTSKTKIVLPYNGPLPADLRDATGAAIVIMQRVGLTVDVLLIVELNGKKHRFSVKASPQEINDILFPFFFGKDGRTRWDTGLSRYNLGLMQGSYINWRRLVLDGNGMDNLMHSKTA